MIELLMVIILVGVLSAIAIPLFLDFRKDAKASALRQNLAMIRTGIKNQILQARLKCGITNPDTWVNTDGYTTFYTALKENMNFNDITHFGTDGSYSHFKICNAAQVPNPNDRLFFNTAGSTLARWCEDGVCGSYSVYPSNPFTRENGWVSNPLGDSQTISYAGYPNGGGICGMATQYMNLNYFIHWVYINDTGEVFPGTNTAGVRECSF